jgi:hypothetical protein
VNGAAISGSTKECAEDMFERYEWESLRLELAKFSNVGTGTVRRWKQESLPKGAPLICLRIFLELLGYDVEELRTLPSHSHDMARMIALGLQDVEEIRAATGYISTNGVYDLILRGLGVYPDKAFRIERLVGDFKEEILLRTEEKALQLSQRLPLVVPGSPVPPTDPSNPSGSPKTNVAEDASMAPPLATEGEVSINAELVAQALVHSLESVDDLVSVLSDSSEADAMRRSVVVAFGRTTLRRLLDDLERMLD